MRAEAHIVRIMEKTMSTMDFVKGISIGVVAGGTIGICLRNDSRRSKRMNGKAVKKAGRIIQNVTDAFSS